ncbi:TPA: hypothetical protein DIC39_00915 [Patescibacteria group bacterium]|nr:MAG: hypothetical protein A2047_04305 [Omnitrophica bacterium GWA2_41_15]HCU47610.1 hypothetical protein [Patescibacteria group bacterium]
MIKNNEKWIIIILAVFILAFTFWWYEWRPSHYIKACQLWAMDRMKATQSSDAYHANVFFEKCLRENGIYFGKYSE